MSTVEQVVDEKKGWSTPCRAGNFATCEGAGYRCVNPRHKNAQRPPAAETPKKRTNASPSKSPRSKRDPKVELVWEDPPARTNGRRPLQEILEAEGVLDELRAHPGDWARLVTYGSASGAGGAVKKLKQVEALADFEFIAKAQPQVDGATTSGSWLYGRFID